MTGFKADYFRMPCFHMMPKIRLGGEQIVPEGPLTSAAQYSKQYHE